MTDTEHLILIKLRLARIEDRLSPIEDCLSRLTPAALVAEFLAQPVPRIAGVVDVASLSEPLPIIASSKADFNVDAVSSHPP